MWRSIWRKTWCAKSRNQLKLVNLNVRMVSEKLLENMLKTRTKWISKTIIRLNMSFLAWHHILFAAGEVKCRTSKNEVHIRHFQKPCFASGTQRSLHRIGSRRPKSLPLGTLATNFSHGFISAWQLMLMIWEANAGDEMTKWPPHFPVHIGWYWMWIAWIQAFRRPAARGDRPGTECMGCGPPLRIFYNPLLGFS